MSQLTYIKLKTKNTLLDYSTKAKRLVEGSHSDLTSKEVVLDAISKPFNPPYLQRYYYVNPTTESRKQQNSQKLFLS